jgi:Spy/CpxP family protein refolding chaperone
MKKHIVKISAVAFLVIALTSGLSAERAFGGKGWGNGGPGMQMRNGPMGDPGMHLLKASEKLGLTDAQEAAILELSQDFRRDMKNHRQSAKPVREKLENLRESGMYDEQAIREALDELHPIMTEGMLIRAKYKSEISDLLTDDQKEQIEKFRESMKGKFEKRMRMRMGEGSFPSDEE